MAPTCMGNKTVVYREEVEPGDCDHVRRILESCSSFSRGEVEVAVDLVKERLAKGVGSGYHFLFAEYADRVVGYVCFGPVPCTTDSFDVYWIAVHRDFWGSGIGKELLARSESRIAALGGSRIYIETSSRDTYESARFFYRTCGYREEAALRDFYAPGDSKVIYVKILRPPA